VTRSWSLVLRAVAIAGLAASSCGCSVIGLALGSRTDNAAEKQMVEVQPASLPFLAQGTRVTLVMADSTRITGRTLDPGCPVNAASTPTHVRVGTGSGISVDVAVVPIAQVRSAMRVPPHHATREQALKGLKVDLVVLALLAAYGIYIGIGAALESMSGYN
jgi:hypothetical protein